MFQIDVASAVPTLPALAAAGTPGFFTDGDVVGGEQATILTADFMNMLMMELINILAGVGANPSKTTMTQLRDAMPAFNGNSVVFPSGLILNWGSGSTTDATGAKAVNFATPFTNAASIFSWASNKATGAPTAFHATGGETKTGMTVECSTSSGVPAGIATAFNWFALGR